MQSFMLYSLHSYSAVQGPDNGIGSFNLEVARSNLVHSRNDQNLLQLNGSFSVLREKTKLVQPDPILMFFQEVYSISVSGVSSASAN